MEKYKSLYIRVTEDTYNKVTNLAKENGTTLCRYVISCILNNGEDLERCEDKAPPRSKVLYCRMSTEDYKKVVKRAKENKMKVTQYVVKCISDSTNTTISGEVKKPKNKKLSKALYCRVTEEFHKELAERAKEKNMSITQYVNCCIENKCKS